MGKVSGGFLLLVLLCHYHGEEADRVSLFAAEKEYVCSWVSDPLSHAREVRSKQLHIITNFTTSLLCIFMILQFYKSRGEQSLVLVSIDT